MYKYTTTYENYNGETVSEDLFFHFTETEILSLELENVGGLEAMLDKVIQSKDRKEIIRVFKYLILNSYGEKSEDGKHFMKTPEIRQKFECSEAYNQMFMLLSTNATEAAKFINGVKPKSLGGDVISFDKVTGKPTMSKEMMEKLNLSKEQLEASGYVLENKAVAPQDHQKPAQIPYNPNRNK